MADISFSGPVGVIVEAVSRVFVALIENDTTRRATMSDASRLEQDKILAQIYWDWRSFQQKVGIVGEPKS